MYFKAKFSASLHDFHGKIKRKKLYTSTSLVHPWEQFPNAKFVVVPYYFNFLIMDLMVLHFMVLDIFFPVAYLVCELLTAHNLQMIVATSTRIKEQGNR